MKTTSVLIALLCLFAVSSFAHEEPHGAVMPKDFEKLKTLVGHWEGTTKKGDKEQTVTADYELTSGGTAIVEKLFAGTPHEMVSVYHADGGTVAMTHYCAMGNHPKMKMKKADEKTVAFEMTGADGVKSMKETHMHALQITWTSPTQIEEDWTSFENGKIAETAVFKLAKK